MDVPILHKLPLLVAEMLPNDYIALDLASGDGKDSLKIAKQAEVLGKKGKFVKVDPYIVHEDVTKEFME